MTPGWGVIPQPSRDFPFIQTNLTTEDVLDIAQGRGLRKYRALPSESFEQDKVKAKASVELYEEILVLRKLAGNLY